PVFGALKDVPMLRTFVSAQTTGDGVTSRRGFMKSLAAVSTAGAITLSWRDMLLARANELQKSGKRMILLWMDGGPSQYDTFNPKPGSEYQGPTQAIDTNVAGIQIGEHWPKTAQVFDKIALIRSMVSDEKDHFRAIKLVRTSRVVLSPLLDAFSLDKEPEKLRDAYGRNPFGQGCLLARRLVEAGVNFIEVITSGTLNVQGWDTHKRGFAENPILARETDSGYAMLLTDLADRGLLDHTLVVWMGEFCRTPKYEDDAGGRKHYSEGWLVGLSGGGVKLA